MVITFKSGEKMRVDSGNMESFFDSIDKILCCGEISGIGYDDIDRIDF